MHELNESFAAARDEHSQLLSSHKNCLRVLTSLDSRKCQIIARDLLPRGVKIKRFLSRLPNTFLPLKLLL